VPRGELVTLGDIENIYKKRKHDKASRLETVRVCKTTFNLIFYLHCYKFRKDKRVGRNGDTKTEGKILMPAKPTRKRRRLKPSA